MASPALSAEQKALSLPHPNDLTKPPSFDANDIKFPDAPPSQLEDPENLTSLFGLRLHFERIRSVLVAADNQSVSRLAQDLRSWVANTPAKEFYDEDWTIWDLVEIFWAALLSIITQIPANHVSLQTRILELM